MSGSSNSIVIDSGKVLITERKKPIRTIYYFAVFLVGLQAVFLIVNYEATREIYNLAAGTILAFCVGLIVSREIFFRTYRDQIDVNKISGVKIQKVLFGCGNVYLKLRLKNKTRVVVIDRYSADRIKRELDRHS